MRYAISDIHGCLHTFNALLERINFSRADELYLLGDFIDRGPDSKGVLDRIFSLQNEGYQLHCLRGNHDEMLLMALDDSSNEERWVINGGDLALRSFGCTKASDVPEPYVSFIRNLPLYLKTDGYILVHAGLNFQHENPYLDTHAMLWIRNWYGQVDRNWLNGRVVVHGHTPVGRDTIVTQLEHLDQQGYIDIDCGCCYAGNPYKSADLGHLCALNLDTRELVFVDNCEK